MAGIVVIEIDIDSKERDGLLLRLLNAMAETDHRNIEQQALDACKVFVDELVGVPKNELRPEKRTHLGALATAVNDAARHADFIMEVREFPSGNAGLEVWAPNGAYMRAHFDHDQHSLTLAVVNMSHAAQDVMRDALLFTAVQVEESRAFTFTMSSNTPEGA